MSLELTEADIRRICARNGTKIPDGLEPDKPAPVRRKYGNNPTERDGKHFDSKHEADRYDELMLMVKAGESTNLRCQVRYELVPKSKKTRGVAYVADFVYVTRDGREIVEDAKGVRTQAYIIKKKLMKHVCGIEIREV